MTLTAVEHSSLRIYEDTHPGAPLHETSDAAEIARHLKEISVRFERWKADVKLAAEADQDAVIAAYRRQIDALMTECGYQSVDVVRMVRGSPNAEEARKKFLNEHSHSEDEVRFFVEGRGAFYLRVNGRVYQTVCVRGDLISVPAGTMHWFDMGPDPEFTAIRLFTSQDGWVAQFTGDEIAQRFPKLT